MAEKRKDSKGRNLRTGESERKDGRYVFRYTKNGKTSNIYATTLGELREKEEEIQRDIQDGIDSNSAKTLTLNKTVERYMQSRTDWKPTSRASYNNVFVSHVKDDIGIRKVGTIKYSDIRDFYTKIVEEKGLGVTTLNHIDSIIHPALDVAVKDGIIRNNPANHVASEIKKKYSLKRGKKVAMSIPEQKAFVEFVPMASRYNHTIGIITFLLGTGCRIGEALGLTWDDVDFEGNTVAIRRTLLYRSFDGQPKTFHVSTPKTKAGERTIPMLSGVKNALLEEKKIQAEKKYKPFEVDRYSGFVFINPLSEKPYTHAIIDHALHAICDEYNLYEGRRAAEENREPFFIPRISAHILRHTFATRFCENETNIKVIQDIMGHSNIHTTMDIYVNATREAKQASIENLEGNIFIG